jgi:SAM-dependent methyltransferase
MHPRMSIQSIPFTLSPGLKKELDFFTTTDQGRKIYFEIKGVGDLVSLIESRPDYMDLKTLLERFPQGRLLDVGVSWGLTSAYWGVKGYDVTCLEPSPEACRGMEEFNNSLGLQNKIYCGPAEVLDRIPGDFDYVVFWSSLHHCDDPLLAINNAYTILRPGGWAILFEPVLRFFRTKRWFYQMMEQNPQKIGHYGGNEHSYRYPEYLDFLTQAGFYNISSRPSDKYGMIPQRAPWDNATRWRIKILYYRLTQRITANPNQISGWMIRLSLLQPVIFGQKRFP